MNKLNVKLLDPKAKTPTIAHPGEDLAYDIYALEDTTILRGHLNKIRTGIAATAYREETNWAGRKIETRLGLLIRDRSSMAAKGIIVTGGVIDPGYTDEILVIMHATIQLADIKAGDKIAQMIPIEPLTGNIYVVGELEPSRRGKRGFGSSGS